MLEKYDLDEFLRDVDQDDDLDRNRFTSKVSQDDILKIVQQRKKKARKEE